MSKCKTFLGRAISIVFDWPLDSLPRVMIIGQHEDLGVIMDGVAVSLLGICNGPGVSFLRW